MARGRLQGKSGRLPPGGQAGNRPHFMDRLSKSSAWGLPPLHRVGVRRARGEALLGLQQSVSHQHAHQPVEGLAGGSPVRIADRLVRSAWACFASLGSFAVDPPSSPPGLTPPVPLPGVVADDLNHLDGTEGGPQSAEGRELVIVGLRHTTIMPPAWPEHRPAALAGVTRQHLPLSMLRPREAFIPRGRNPDQAG